MSLNKACLLGNVGSDPEIKVFENGNKVANFSIATSENWKNKEGEKQMSTEWHKVAVFGKLADIVEKYVKKGQQLYVEGKIKTRSWGDGSEKKYTTEVVLNGFGDILQMIGKRESQDQGESYSNSIPPAPEPGDLPF